MPILSRSALLRAIIQPPTTQTSPTDPNTPKNRQGTARVTLPSGLHGIVAERPDSALVGLTLRVRAGTGSETDENNGCAHVIEHVVFKGGGERKPGGLDAAMERLGGEFFARTTRDFTEVTAALPTGKALEGLRLLAEVVRNPAFRPDDVEQEKRVIRREMAAADSDPAKSGFRLVSAIAYPGTHPYRLPLMGTPESLAHLTPEHLHQFWETWYRPEHMTLAVAGDIKAASVLKEAEKLFPPREKRSDNAASLIEFTPIGRIARAETPAAIAQGRTVTTVVYAFRVPPARDADTLPILDTLVPALTANSRLADQLILKDKVALSVSAEFVPGILDSLFLVNVATRPETVGTLEKAFTAQLRRLREDPWTDEEAESARVATEGRMRYAMETVEGHSRLLANWDHYAPSLTEETYPVRVASVGREELRAATLRCLTPLSFAVATIGPAPASVGEGTP